MSKSLANISVTLFSHPSLSPTSFLGHLHPKNPGISRKLISQEIDPKYGLKLEVRFEEVTSMIKCVLYRLTGT